MRGSHGRPETLPEDLDLAITVVDCSSISDNEEHPRHRNRQGTLASATEGLMRDLSAVPEELAASPLLPAAVMFRLVAAMEGIAFSLERIAAVAHFIPTDEVPTKHDQQFDTCHPLKPATKDPAFRSPDMTAGNVPEPTANQITDIATRLKEVYDLLRRQDRSIQAADKQFYVVDEAVEVTGFKAWTLRQACNKGRIQAKKGDDGRWRIPREEVQRIQEEGLPAA